MGPCLGTYQDIENNPAMESPHSQAMLFSENSLLLQFRQVEEGDTEQTQTKIRKDRDVSTLNEQTHYTLKLTTKLSARATRPMAENLTRLSRSSNCSSTD